jgi:hypothetical protein
MNPNLGLNNNQFANPLLQSLSSYTSKPSSDIFTNSAITSNVPINSTNNSNTNMTGLLNNTSIALDINQYLYSKVQPNFQTNPLYNFQLQQQKQQQMYQLQLQQNQQMFSNNNQNLMFMNPSYNPMNFNPTVFNNNPIQANNFP